MPKGIFGDRRPAVWVSDPLGAQQGHAEDWQVCLAHRLRKVPYTNNASERALRPSVVFRKVTNGFRSQCGRQLFAAARSVIDTGRQNGLSVFQAIRTTPDGNSIFMPAWRYRGGEDTMFMYVFVFISMSSLFCT